MAELAVREALALVEEVIIILYQKFERPTNLHDDVEKVQNILEMMHECVRESEDGIGEDRQLFLDVAYLFEDALEKFMLQLVTDETLNGISEQTDDEVADFIRSWKERCKLFPGFEEIIDQNTSFFERLDSLLQNHISEGGSRSRPGDSSTFSYRDPAEGDQVVGFEEHQEKLLKQLTEERDSKLLTIFIVGPGGSGKSTLAKNVFESEQVQGFFHCKAWVAVTRQPLQLNELLVNMLTSLEVEKPALVEQVDDPKAKLRLFLQQKRYLVVLDDVWRKQDLQYIVKAWAKDLFCRKAFHDGQGTCPPVLKRFPDHWPTRKSKAFDKSKGYYLFELEECSDKILKWCGGLPLAISAVGTLLAKKPQTQVEWEEFLENIGTEIRPGSSLSIISSILEPSYMDLPNHLKTCFLYLGVFPAHYRIQRERLFRLWVAEGFVKPIRGITVEQVAQGYLNELISRNLVLIAGKREFYEIVDGQEPSCCVVKLVRDFIISKAENFITVLEPNCSTSTSRERIRRLSVHGTDHVIMQLKHIRTLLFFADYYSYGLEKAKLLETVLKTSKFVRVIDFKGVCVSDFPKSVDGLILLKYLSLLGSEITTVPKSIWKLRFLETLELGSMVNELPEEICQLYTLRHLLVFPHRGVKFCGGNIGALSSMQGLALINVRNDGIIIKALGELKDLRKLGVSHLETKDGKELCISLEKMKHLSTLDVVANSWESLDLDHMQCPPLYLQHLYLEGSRGRLPMWISKLTSLQTLRLKYSHLNANPLDVLQALPNLMELHLLAYYSGEELVFRADTFKKLMTLHINLSDTLNLIEVEDRALSMLRELTISGCPNLKSLRYGLPVLRELTISHCPNLEFCQYDLLVLRKLTISHCPNLELCLYDLPVLTELTISHRPNLELCRYDATVLRKLTISHCPNLEFLGRGLPMLTELTFSHCPYLMLGRYDLPVLTELTFSHCPYLMLWLYDLPVLRKLTISHCLNLEFLGCGLPMLRELSISHCPNLELRRYDLPMLTELTISHCPNLKLRRDDLPMLRELTISHCPNLKLRRDDLPMLRELTISHCPNLKLRRYDLSVLRELTISNCPHLESLPYGLPVLKELTISHCPNLESLPYDLHVLRELTISHCPNLESLPSDLPVLRELTICHCRNLKSLPYGLPVLNSLYTLVLHDMPRKFIAMLQNDSPDRLMVRHIPDIYSYKHDTVVQDLSENVLSTSNTRPKADHTEKTRSETGGGGGIITCGTKTELDLQDLPDGCKANIIWLTSPQDACRLCSISRDFKSAAESDADWDKFLPPEIHTILSQSAEPGLVARSKRELYLTLCDNPVLIGKGKMSFSLDKWSGKKCYMISARDLHITWGSTPQYWTWTSDPESRFEEVAELLEVVWLEIRGKLDTHVLSPSTLYKAYLVFKFTARAHGFIHLPTQVSVGLEGGETTKQTVFLHNKREVNQPEGESNDDQYQKERSDGWLEIELGDFFCGGGEDGQLNMICLNTGGHWKRGLIVEGIEVRPKRTY